MSDADSGSGSEEQDLFQNNNINSLSEHKTELNIIPESKKEIKLGSESGPSESEEDWLKKYVEVLVIIKDELKSIKEYLKFLKSKSQKRKHPKGYHRCGVWSSVVLFGVVIILALILFLSELFDPTADKKIGISTRVSRFIELQSSYISLSVGFIAFGSFCYYWRYVFCPPKDVQQARSAAINR